MIKKLNYLEIKIYQVIQQQHICVCLEVEWKSLSILSEKSPIIGYFEVTEHWIHIINCHQLLQIRSHHNLQSLCMHVHSQTYCTQTPRSKHLLSTLWLRCKSIRCLVRLQMTASSHRWHRTEIQFIIAYTEIQMGLATKTTNISSVLAKKDNIGRWRWV